MQTNPGIVQHEWDLSPKAAIQIQKQLKDAVALRPLKDGMRYIGGADISYNKFCDVIYAGIVLLEYQSQQVVAQHGKPS